MSEKHYLVVEITGGLANIYDNLTEYNIMDVSEAVEQLNKITKENTQLKEKLKAYEKPEKRFKYIKQDSKDEYIIDLDNGTLITNNLPVICTYMNKLEEKHQQYKNKVKKILQKHYNKELGLITHYTIEKIAEELKVNLK